MSDEMKGSCLCGAVSFTASPSTMEMGVCHCSMCRKWSGGTFMAVSCDSINIEDETHLKAFQASKWGERLFCDKCGSTLIWRTQDHKHSVMAAQAFDDPSKFEFTSEIFVDNKPDNFEFANPTKKMTEAQVMAQFAPPAESN